MPIYDDQIMENINNIVFNCEIYFQNICIQNDKKIQNKNTYNQYEFN